MCVIPGCAGLSSLDAWSQGFDGILATKAHFRSPFRSKVPILQRLSLDCKISQIISFPLFLHFLAPNDLPSDFDHSKTYVKSK